LEGATRGAHGAAGVGDVAVWRGIDWPSCVTVFLFEHVKLQEVE
jgi:hypothetical protein